MGTWLPPAFYNLRSCWQYSVCFSRPSSLLASFAGTFPAKFRQNSLVLTICTFGHGHVVLDLQQGRNERDEGLLQRFGTFLFFSIALMLSFVLQHCNAVMQQSKDSAFNWHLRNRYWTVFKRLENLRPLVASTQVRVRCWARIRSRARLAWCDPGVKWWLKKV